MWKDRHLVRVMAVMGLLVFVIETLVMLLLAQLPPIHGLAEAFIDSFLLVLIFFPTLYIFLTREKDGKRRMDLLTRQREISPLRFSLFISILVFMAESIVMFVMAHLPPLPAIAEALADSLLLTLLFFPLLYYFMVREEETLRRQNEFLLSILESLNHPFYVIDAATYRVILSNSAAIGNIPEKNPFCYALFHANEKPCEPPDHVCPMAEIKETGRPVIVEHTHRTPGGEARNVEIHSHPIFDKKGKVIQIIEYTFDVTERKRAEEALSLSELKFRSVTQSANSGIISTDAESRIVFWNRAAEKMFGYTEEEMLGRPLITIMPERFREAHLAGMKRYLETGEARVIGKTVELVGVRKSGEEFPLELSLASWQINHSTFFTGILDDITERKIKEEELKASNERLKGALAKLKEAQNMLVRSEKLVSIGTLSAGVAHEILNPLNIISAIVQVLKMESLPPKVGEDLDEIMTQINRATKITNNLRMFAHQKTREITPVDIHELFDKTATLIEHDLNLENMVIERAYDRNIPLIQADEDQLAQVFLNLLNNAKDAMKGRQGNTIKIQTTAGENGVEIRFSDNGPGIPEKILGKIFDPFFTTKDPGQGTGLGLSILHSTIENHGGSIRVESGEGKGAAFIIFLPVDGREMAEKEGQA